MLAFWVAAIALFQSTPLREGRLSCSNSIIIQNVFQSTPLREGRPRREPTVFVERLFQSTPLREGRRERLVTYNGAEVVSIHAPARGATLSLTPLIPPWYVSIHAPARGATAWPFCHDSAWLKRDVFANLRVSSAVCRPCAGSLPSNPRDYGRVALQRTSPGIPCLPEVRTNRTQTINGPSGS